MNYLLYIALSLTGLLSYLGVVASLQDPTAPVVAVSIGLCAATLFFARAGWLQDPIAFGKFMVGILLAVAGFSALPAFFGDDPQQAKATFAVSGILAVVGIVLVRRHAWRDEGTSPNLLAGFAGHDAIFEEEGVHFVVSTPQDTSCIQVGLQNCWDHPREVEIHVHEGKLNGHWIKVLPVAKVPLSALEVGVLAISFSAGTPGRHTLILSVEVSGDGGSRCRSFRGRPASKSITPGSFLLHLAMGEIAWGGGIRVDIECSQDQVRTDEPPPPQWTRLSSE